MYPWELELGSCWRPSGCLVEGSVRTFKKYFKTTCREFRWCITVGSYRSYSDESRTKCPPRDTITLLYIRARKVSCENCASVLGVVVWSYWLKILSIDRIFTSGSIRHMNVIASHVLFNPSERTGYHSSTSGFRRLISLHVTRSTDPLSIEIQDLVLK